MGRNGLLLLAMLVVSGSVCRAADTKPADSVWLNARVYTVERQQPWAEAVAFRGDEIMYVGDSSGARALVGADTRLRDLQGKLVLPGFIETHMHIGTTLPNVFAVQLRPEMSAAQVLDAITAHAAANPQQEPVVGFGFLAAAFGERVPTAAAAGPGGT
jgi:predicted amidohydrolase YtcJ